MKTTMGGPNPSPSALAQLGAQPPPLLSRLASGGAESKEGGWHHQWGPVTWLISLGVLCLLGRDRSGPGSQESWEAAGQGQDLALEECAVSGRTGGELPR